MLPKPQWTLCLHTGQLAEKGVCPVHGGDACLKVFVPASAYLAAIDEERSA